MTTHWKAVLGVILIFIFGFCAGVVCTSIFVQRKALAILQHPAVAVSAALEKRLTGNLDLDANQKEQVHQYFVENLEHRKQFQAQIQPGIQLANRETFQQIRSILRPDQLERFHQNLVEFRKRFGKNALNPNASLQNPFELNTQSDGSPANPGAAASPPAK